MSTPPQPRELLAKASAARRDGNYVRQLDAARKCAMLPGDHREAALLEALEALVFLSRFGEARALISMLGRVGGPRTKIRVTAWHSYVEVLEGHPTQARELLDGVAELVEQHAQPHDRFLILISRSRMEQAADEPLPAIDHAEQAMALAPEAGGEAMVMAHEHLGHLWLDLGMIDCAVATFEAGLELADLPAARRAALHVGACIALRKADRPNAAVRHGEKAVALQFAGKRTYREGVARLALAEALLAARRRAEALAEVQRAIERVRTGRSIVTEMEGRLCLAKVLLAEGLHEAAAHELEQVRWSQATRLHDEAAVLLAEMSDDPSDPDLKRLVLRYDTLGPALQARVAWVMGNLSTNQGRREQGLDWFGRYGRALEAAATHEARRHYRVVELREQMNALRRERARGEELAEALRTQEQLREAAETAEAERRDLMELVAHDLRNPLSALLLMLDSVDEAEDVDEVRELVVLGKRSAQAMRSVLDEALDASGSIGELGDTQPVDLDEVVRASVGAFEAGARAKGQTLVPPEPSGAVVEGVPGLLRSVLDNLLSNALKFTPRGGSIQVYVARASGIVEVSIQDDGPGLQPGEAERLFDRRVKGSARPTDGEASTGLGLYLVRKVVEGHRGTVSAWSEGPGEGATFSVRLPVTGR